MSSDGEPDPGDGEPTAAEKAADPTGLTGQSKFDALAGLNTGPAMASLKKMLAGNESSLKKAMELSNRMSGPPPEISKLPQINYRSAVHAIDDLANGQRKEHRERLEREEQALQLTAQLVAQQARIVEQQELLVDNQRQQAEEAKTTRWLEIAVLVVSVLALIATVIGVVIAVSAKP